MKKIVTVELDKCGWICPHHKQVFHENNLENCCVHPTLLPYKLIGGTKTFPIWCPLSWVEEKVGG